MRKIAILSIPNYKDVNYVAIWQDMLDKNERNGLGRQTWTSWTYKLNEYWKEKLEEQKPFPIYYYWTGNNIGGNKKYKIAHVANVIDYKLNQDCPDKKITSDREREFKDRNWLLIDDIKPLSTMKDISDFSRLENKGRPNLTPDNSLTRKTMSIWNNKNAHFMIVEKI